MLQLAMLWSQIVKCKSFTEDICKSHPVIFHNTEMCSKCLSPFFVDSIHQASYPCIYWSKLAHNFVPLDSEGLDLVMPRVIPNDHWKTHVFSCPRRSLKRHTRISSGYKEIRLHSTFLAKLCYITHTSKWYSASWGMSFLKILRSPQIISKEYPLALREKNNEQKINYITLFSTTSFIHDLNHKIIKFNKWN